MIRWIPGAMGSVALVGMALFGGLSTAWASCETQTADVTYTPLMVLGQDPCNLTGSRKTTLTTLLAGEDQTNNVLMVNVLPRNPAYTATNTWTPPATPTDLVTITGSATKTTTVKERFSVRLFVDPGEPVWDNMGGS